MRTSDKLPTARQVKQVIGQVDVGSCRVSHHDNWGDARFPWRVYGPPDESGDREMLDDFAQYREAVAYARKVPLPCSTCGKSREWLDGSWRCRNMACPRDTITRLTLHPAEAQDDTARQE